MLCCVSTSLLAEGSWLFMFHGARYPLSCRCQRDTPWGSHAIDISGTHTDFLVALYCHLQQQLLHGVFLEKWPTRAFWSLAYLECWLLVMTPSNCTSVSELSVCFLNTYVPPKQAKVKLVLLREQLCGSSDLVLHWPAALFWITCAFLLAHASLLMTLYMDY